jgi:hypothetical protein
VIIYRVNWTSSQTRSLRDLRKSIHRSMMIHVISGSPSTDLWRPMWSPFLCLFTVNIQQRCFPNTIICCCKTNRPTTNSRHSTAITLPKHLSSSAVFSGVRVTRSLVFYLRFCKSLLVLLSLFLWLLCCLSLDLQLLIIPFGIFKLFFSDRHTNASWEIYPAVHVIT